MKKLKELIAIGLITTLPLFPIDSKAIEVKFEQLSKTICDNIEFKTNYALKYDSDSDEVIKIICDNCDNIKFKINYALKFNSDSEVMHGFGVGIKGFYKSESYNTIDDEDTEISGELSFNLLFGSKRKLYEFGTTLGRGIYGKKDLNSLELIIGLPRMGLVSKNGIGVVWTPEVGIDMNIYPISIQPKVNFYVGSKICDNCGNIEIGFGLNAGISF